MSRRRGTTELDTLKLELNAARAPIWAPRPGVPMQHALRWKPVRVLGEPFRIHELAGVLQPSDLLVFAHVCSRYMIDRPGDRQVRVSPGDVARRLGARNPGGAQLRQAVDTIARLAGGVYESVMRVGGRSTGTELVRGWHLLDEYAFVRQKRTQGRVTLSRVMAERLDSGSFVMFDRELLEQLLDQSGVAARLWLYLEGERLGTMRWAVFNGPEGRPDRERPNPAMADLLRLSGSRRRRQVAADLRAACRIIERLDPMYHLSVDSAGEPGTWTLSATREAKRPPAAPRSEHANPASVVTPAPEADPPGSSVGVTPTRHLVGRLAASDVTPTRHLVGRLAASGVTPEGPSGGVHTERANPASGVTPEGPPVEASPSRHSIEVVPLSRDAAAPQLPVKVIGKRWDDRDDRIARARAAATDTTKSDAVREAARAELDRLGAPL